MTEDTLFAYIGRLYVAVSLRDNEIQRLNRLVSEYEARASGNVIDFPTESEEENDDES
jgi:hypothetical protein